MTVSKGPAIAGPFLAPSVEIPVIRNRPDCGNSGHKFYVAGAVTKIGEETFSFAADKSGRARRHRPLEWHPAS